MKALNIVTAICFGMMATEAVVAQAPSPSGLDLFAYKLVMYNAAAGRWVAVANFDTLDDCYQEQAQRNSLEVAFYCIWPGDWGYYLNRGRARWEQNP